MPVVSLMLHSRFFETDPVRGSGFGGVIIRMSALYEGEPIWMPIAKARNWMGREQGLIAVGLNLAQCANWLGHKSAHLHFRIFADESCPSGLLKPKAVSMLGRPELGVATIGASRGAFASRQDEGREMSAYRCSSAPSWTA